MSITGVECRLIERLDRRLEPKPIKRYQSLTVQIILSGSARVRMGRRWHEVCAPALWLGYPGAWYAQRAGVLPYRRLFLQVGGADTDRYDRAGLLARAPVALADPGPLVATAQLVAERFAAGGPWAARRAALALEDLLIQSAALRGAVPSEDWPQRLLNAFAGPDSAPPDAAVLAQHLELGASTLRRRFRAATGRSLHQAWLAGRVQRACALLRDGATSAATGRAVGFTDPGHFARVFRRHCGCTPSAFRARHGVG